MHSFPCFLPTLKIADAFQLAKSFGRFFIGFFAVFAEISFILFWGFFFVYTCDKNCYSQSSNKLMAGNDEEDEDERTSKNIISITK